jgi:hypothetical protein
MRNGLFAFSPVRLKTAINITLLDFYRCIFERSADAVTAWAAALHTHYRRYGFRIQEERVGESSGRRMQETEDPFRKGLAEAIQWLDALRIQDEHDVEDVIAIAWGRVKVSNIPVEASVPVSGVLPSKPPCRSNVGLKAGQDGFDLTSDRSPSTGANSDCQECTHGAFEVTSSSRDMPTATEEDDITSTVGSIILPMAGATTVKSGDSVLGNIKDHSSTSDPFVRSSVTIEECPDTEDPCSTSAIPQTNGLSLHQGECDRYLQQLCPACFGGSEFGRPLTLYVFLFSDSHAY